MGYVPDSLAQSLRSRTSHLFGLIISAITNPVLARTVMAIEQNAAEAGCEVILCHTLDRVEIEAAAIRRLMARRVDGLYLAPVYRMAPTAPLFEELLRCRIPTVILGHRAPFCSRFPSVETDDLQGGYLAARHLLGLGHRRIVFLAGPPTAPWARERLEGYRKALREAGMEGDDRWVFSAGATIEEGEKAALQMLQEPVRATAVQAVNDLVAIGAGSVLARQGIRVPEDVSMIGYGDILMTGHCRVPLSTVHQPKFSVGIAAAEMMSRLLHGERPEPRRLPVELVLRASTGPVKVTEPTGND
jgi:LacI family transcriptional regulator